MIISRSLNLFVEFGLMCILRLGLSATVVAEELGTAV
jgi:hypothetical protein